jgi:hypothetical protein
MYFIPAIIAAVLASLFYVPNFLDTPIGMLTTRDVVSELGFLAAVLVGLAGLARSIERDSFWPWHWLGLTRPRQRRR